jgi:hypothetical protein
MGLCYGYWNTANVATMEWMFFNAAAFNACIGGWDTSVVVTMEGMFAGASAFDQAIGNWSTSKVRTMTDMFQNAAAFNQPVGAWNVSAIASWDAMFLGATSFKQVLCWDRLRDPSTGHETDNVDSYSSSGGENLFEGTACPGIPRSCWGTTTDNGCAWSVGYKTLTNNNIRDAVRTWCDSDAGVTRAEATYGPINAWDVSEITDMSSLFRAAQCNADISNWNTSAVTSMRFMFEQNDAFNADIDGRVARRLVREEGRHVCDSRYVPCADVTVRRSQRSDIGTGTPAVHSVLQICLGGKRLHQLSGADIAVAASASDATSTESSARKPYHHRHRHRQQQRLHLALSRSTRRVASRAHHSTRCAALGCAGLRWAALGCAGLRCEPRPPAATVSRDGPPQPPAARALRAHSASTSRWPLSATAAPDRPTDRATSRSF